MAREPDIDALYARHRRELLRWFTRRTTDAETALETLAADVRRAVELRVVDELPYPDVARRLSISEPAARARVSRGLRALHRVLDPVVLPEVTP